MKTTIVFLLILISSSELLSAQNGIFSGRVSDEKNGEPLPGVTVRIDGTAYGAVTKKDGSFSIGNIPFGKYTALVSFVGYKPEKFNFEVNKENPEAARTIQMQETVIETSEIIVSANKRVQAVQDVPISVSVVDFNSIRERNITRLDDALRYVPGVTMNYDHVSIRGTSGFAFGLGSRVQVLLDGFPLQPADNGDVKFSSMPMFDIERIEVVKGAGSALYGTGALGGVINIITREPSEKADIRMKAYSGVYTDTKYDEWNYSDDSRLKSGAETSFSKKFGSFGILISGGFEQDDSFREFDETMRWNVFSKMNYDVSDASMLSLTGNFSSNKHDDWVYWNSLDSATVPPADADLGNKITSGKYSVSGAFTHIFDSGNFLKAQSGVYITTFENTPENTDEYRESTAMSINSELQMNINPAEKTVLTIGLNHIFNDVDSDTYGVRTQQIFSGYAQAEYSGIRNLTATAGTRIDFEQTEDLDENLEVSPKIGISWQPDFGVNFRASAGKGFRAAMVAERYASVEFSGFTVIANPGLKPEHSWSFEIGAMYEFEGLGFPLQIDAAFFQNEMYDLIEPMFVESGREYVIQFQNVTRARIQGLELSIKAVPLNLFGFETALTAMNPEDLTLNETLKYRSEILWYNRLFIPFGFLEFQADYRYLSEVVNVDSRLSLGIKDADARVPAHVVDVRIIFRMKELELLPLTITLNAGNLFNYYYTEIPGNLGETRHVSLQAELSL